MELQLDDTYKVSVDKHNFILERNEEIQELGTKIPTGKFKYKHVGYYNNLAILLKRYVNEVIRDEGESSVHTLIDRLNSLSNHIEKVVKKSNIVFVPKEKSKDE
ncbi:hypothetical protein ANABIO32_02640 [Rossellomorea marisflavi]|uniref:hypothetical protein n=1 Tax=Rossellomorea marisflavi TaxID=189381 RepID=UPI0025C770E1|nr:hypothetical protein [Rossellomorea marisflavi]GLI82577.1 hypothetical protein ANABIO32_02640 [Rossellomorea marisflavi]